MGATKSLHARKNKLADPKEQLKFMSNGIFGADGLPHFRNKLSSQGIEDLTPSSLDIFQMNLGYQCNQTCKHCHVDAGPDRKEIMTKSTMQECIQVIENLKIKTVDLTGGAPEMNANFRWLVETVSPLVDEIIVRSNLTIILANPKYHDLPEFFAKHKVRVVSSLPFYNADKTDRQRGQGVFKKSIDALKMLNAVGYGIQKDLILDLVYNPSGAFLPADQFTLERDFKKSLFEEYEIQFNHLLCITNLPVSRFLEYLVVSENYEDYMEKLVEAYNPAALENVMCRNTLSIGWDGRLFDCDFNQMLELPLESGSPQHIRDFNLNALSKRKIQVHQHCYGCTAGAGSSCQGVIT